MNYGQNAYEKLKKQYDKKLTEIRNLKDKIKKYEEPYDYERIVSGDVGKKITGATLSILDANNTKSVSAKTIGFDEIE